MKGEREYSKRLGDISPDQFQAALERLGLGDFVRAETVSSGLFGQNVFVTIDVQIKILGELLRDSSQ